MFAWDIFNCLPQTNALTFGNIGHRDLGNAAAIYKQYDKSDKKKTRIYLKSGP